MIKHCNCFSKELTFVKYKFLFCEHGYDRSLSMSISSKHPKRYLNDHLHYISLFYLEQKNPFCYAIRFGQIIGSSQSN